MPSQKIIIILRHGKAEVGSAGQDDRARVLVNIGIEAAKTMGNYLRKQGKKPDLALCSTAARTRETLQYVQQAFGELKAEYSDKLYLASGGEMLNVLAGLSEDVKCVLIVGHNPGAHQLCLKLAKHGDEDMLDTMHLKFPTCALAVIAVNTPWHDIGHTRGTLLDFATPKMLGGVEE